MDKKSEGSTIYTTTEWRVFGAGVFLSTLLIGAAWYFFETDPKMLQALSLIFVAHALGGRAAGIGLCIMHGLSASWTIAYNFYLEVLIVCFTYSISLLAINNYIKFRAIRYYARLLERKAKRHRGKIERYGWLGLFLFVMTPLPVTGPVVGSIIGSLLQFRVSKNFSACLLGTLAAIVTWTYFFDYLEHNLNIIRYVLLVIIAIVIISYALDLKNSFTKE